MLGVPAIIAMFVDDIKAEQLAEVFHHYHQTLTENLESHRAAPAESWEELPQLERERLVAAARLTLLKINADETRRKYFAKPGEAEWGC